jgi:hypothetical protein
MNKPLFILPFLLFLNTSIDAQVLTQTIRGLVAEEDTEVPIIGASVVLSGTDPLVGTTTNEKGEFSLEAPLGRHTVQVSCVGYKTVSLASLDLTSGKELVLSITMVENVIQTREVVVKANARKHKPINEMAQVSARSFTIEETERYAGSWGDPARMTMNFAGVAAGNDQVNAIAVRGNSPEGVEWLLNGIPIPNPNHFGSLGATSGPISMLNNNTLSNSDFFSGAFPAQYGNASSSVFDLNMRNGNNKKREYMLQAGFNGFELGAEGPFGPKSDASFLANYRYSTLGVFNALGIDMGIGAVPYYQDLAFSINLPAAKTGRFTVFGLGGINSITFDDPEDEYKRKEYTDFSSRMGVLGLNHSARVGENSRIKTTVGVTWHQNTSLSNVYKDALLDSWYGSDMRESVLFASEEFKTKLNTRNTLHVGIKLQSVTMNFLDSIWIEESDLFVRNLDLKGSLLLWQGYAQWQHRLNNQLSLITGLHVQKASINRQIAVEPRTSVEWQFNPQQSVSLGYGLHSQMQARDVYFREVLADTLMGIYLRPNKRLSFSRSHHLVLGYHVLLNDYVRMKTEAYYQYLFDIPVKQYPSSISTINKEAGYYSMNIDSLVNRGKGRNLGLEITLERFLNRQFYYLITLSVFDSKYRASDKILRNTAYNGNLVMNFLGGYEFRLGKHNTLAIDAKATCAGGMRSVPIDIEASRAKGETVYDYQNAFEKRNPTYYRADLRISFRMNGKRSNQEWALDISNITNHKNYFFEVYNPDTDRVEQIGQMGILPVMLWRMRF